MKVRKTTFEEEQRQKDEAFLKLTPHQRLAIAYQVRERMKKDWVDYSFAGKKVKITRMKP